MASTTIARFSTLEALNQQLQTWAPETAGAADPSATVLAEFDHAVIFARVTPKGVEWAPSGPAPSPDSLLDLRCFGERGEWHLWRLDATSFAARYLGGQEGAVDTFQEQTALWGTVATRLDGNPGWSRVSEERGYAFTVPLDRSGSLAGNHAVRLTVHHFIRYDVETGLAGVEDSRLVRLA